MDNFQETEMLQPEMDEPEMDEPEVANFPKIFEMFENFRNSPAFFDIFDDDEDFLAFSAGFGILILLLGQTS
jgi:hypothetical protein